jgi:diguanylate cyclase (GGDEF)-like protein
MSGIKTITTVRYDNYSKLLRLLVPSIDLAIIFNEQGQFIWQSKRRLHEQMDRILAAVQAFQRQPALSRSTEVKQPLGENEELQIFEIQDNEIESQLTLVLISITEKHRNELSTNQKTAIHLLNKTLLTEYSLIKKTVEKELELNTVADELTRRYEELNLIYASNDSSKSPAHGREMLQRIVVNASNYMDIDLVAIILPDKHISVQFSKPVSTSHQFPHLLNGMRDNVLKNLKRVKTSIVVNHSGDAEKARIFLQMPYKFIVSPILDTENDVTGLVTIVNSDDKKDFTNGDRNLLEVLANKASNVISSNFDPLTGLENNHSFELIILDVLRKTWKNGSQHAIAQLDIDKMAVINATSGMQAGNALIKTIAEIIKRVLRASDTVSRRGADKFTMLLRDCDLVKAHLLLTKIAREVRETPFYWGEEVHEISVCIGIAPISAELQSVSNIISNVESALLSAKERGHDQLQVYQLDDAELLKRKTQIQWVNRIQLSLRQDRFQLFAQLIQPLVKAESLPHFEILIRLQDEQGGFIPPDKFLPSAEKFFLMPGIDRWVIQKTFQALYEQQQLTGKASCHVSINLSGQSFADRGLDEFIVTMFEQYPLEPEIFCFEVTESAAIANFVEAQVFIERIKNLGCKFSLDDFGTGLSSFAYLKDMNVDYLKIDGSFVKAIVEDEVSHSMVAAMNQIGHAMKLETIAEYVENQSIQDLLQDIGVDYVQGYHVQKPQPFHMQLENIATDIRTLAGKNKTPECP